MFGMGFTEMLLIAVVAVIFLGPEKLPGTMVEIAKILKKVTSTVTDMKASLNDQLQLDDIKSEALSYKKELLDTKEELTKANPIDHFKEQTAKAREQFTSLDSSANDIDKEIKEREREQKIAKAIAKTEAKTSKETPDA